MSVLSKFVIATDRRYDVRLVNTYRIEYDVYRGRIDDHTSPDEPASGPVRTPGRRPPRHRVQTRHLLMESAEQLLIERGYAHVSVSDMCAAAGFTRGAFYSNFATKDDLTLALFERHARHNLALLQSLLVDVPARPAGDWVRKFFIVDPRNRGWILLFLEFRLYAVRQPDLATKLDQHDDAIAGELADILNQRLGLDGRLSRETAKAILAAREGVLARSVRADRTADDIVHAATITITELLSALKP